ncbi:uncharacterized protein [Palaemon carinicauda]|uniref:uncharacterized protein n=1 Tax=Palaemon carinicauda TaxID=392227 RepID=UPI0035B5EFFD
MSSSNDQATNGLSPGLAQLCTDYWNWRMKDSPEFATAVGIHDYDDQLDDLSLEAYQRRYEQCEAFLARARDLEPKLTLQQDLTNMKAFKAEIQAFVDGFQFQGFLIPIGFSEGVHVDFERLISYMKLEEVADYQKVIARYQQLPKQINQILLLMKRGAETGVVHHQISMKGVGKSLDRFVVSDATKSPLWTPFSRIPNTINNEQQNLLQEMAKKVILQQISPAFEKLRDFVDKEYITRPDIAVTSLQGEARYDQLLKFHTSTNLSATEIHKMGLEEVDRIQKEMAKIVKELGFEMSVLEFSDMIRYDPKSYFNNPEDMMDKFKEIVYDIIEPKLQNIITKRPKTDLELVVSPSSDGVLGYYLAGSYDGTRPGKFYVNTQLYASIPRYEMMTLCLHEGNPGHHLQASHTMESPHIPFFRRVIEDRNYQIAPSRFPINTGYLEGWGLYSEDLGFDMNLYDDPYDRYGHYSYEMYRACRLVVDTGMHAFNWSRERAIDFMKKHTALATKNIENEVDRYITFPGQALGYKVGELKIWELRRRAQEILGESFDIKKFHDIVLDSVGPLEVLEDEVTKWIEDGRKK